MKSNVESCYKFLRELLIDGDSIDEAVDQLRRIFTPEAVESARKLVEREPIKVDMAGESLIIDNKEFYPWLNDLDRTEWKFWPHFRGVLEDKRWPVSSILSLDKTTDKVLNLLNSPNERQFRSMGLVLGYVQSGKTSHYTGLIAKAADAGYGIFVVLSGITNTLRYQTQKRLQKELLNRFSREFDVLSPPEIDADFTPGTISSSILHSPSPKIMVIKKICPVLQRLNQWLADTEISQAVMIIDDEADQASVNTGGNRRNIRPVQLQETHPANNEEEDEEASPSRTNSLIRQIVNRFDKVSYVAYTATPFANVFIPPDAHDREAGLDLYPRDFIYSLPHPNGYIGVEEVFGLTDTLTGEDREELPIIRVIDNAEIGNYMDGTTDALPESLRNAIKQFILAGACYLYRGLGNSPATMLIHISRQRDDHQVITEDVEAYFYALKNDWLYSRRLDEVTIYDEMRELYESDFLPTTQEINDRREFEEFSLPSFDELVPLIDRFLHDLLNPQTMNSDSEFNLDYDQDPSMKVIVIGGDKLSRGLTLEGLLVSYFARPGNKRMYDTLMQMGRWFGYRGKYLDLTRIYTTDELRLAFRDLSLIELDLREQIKRYEIERKTPMEFQLPVLSHALMVPTNPLKMQQTIIENISYAAKFKETITFPEQPTDWMEGNILAVRNLIASIGRPPDRFNSNGSTRYFPVWDNVGSDIVLEFLNQYQTDGSVRNVSSRLMRDYIERQNNSGELVQWTIGIAENKEETSGLGTIDLGVPGKPNINLINRARLIDPSNSLKRITNKEDEEIDLTAEELREVERLRNEDNSLSRPLAIRIVRSVSKGLLLIYPISRYSVPTQAPKAGKIPTRKALFDDPVNNGIDIMGLAISFPSSDTAERTVYIRGLEPARTA